MELDLYASTRVLKGRGSRGRDLTHTGPTSIFTAIACIHSAWTNSREIQRILDLEEDFVDSGARMEGAGGDVVRIAAGGEGVAAEAGG